MTAAPVVASMAAKVRARQAPKRSVVVRDVGSAGTFASSPRTGTLLGVEQRAQLDAGKRGGLVGFGEQ
jgi:hypothetical protein